MAIFKCKMCGGTIEFNQGDTVGICDSCGTKQTLPRLDDDKKANLYDRANHFRRNNDYDKAMGIYEQILNEDNKDSEAYWSLVLCRYGIEYVEDPSTHKRVPTVNRAQFTSIFDDDNYKQALHYADSSQRVIYEQEATLINEIQKGILAISQKEEPFDVFICYKETDNNGRRTQDSVLANDLYHQLAQEGFKVFFSRITLEDKLGTAYEPYIFAALNSAKVMVVIGTRSENFNAVWVKNEWSRFLALVKNDSSKVLIPAYRDMDPYDLPEEFSHLQAQDMSKLGFMQDLIRGIKKIADGNVGVSKSVNKEAGAVRTGNGNVDSLLKRVFMFLEDGNWSEADAYCEKVLDIEPENAEAYLGKLMAEYRAPKQEMLANCQMRFDISNNYKKVMKFGDEKLKKELEEYHNASIYRRAVYKMDGAVKTEDYGEAHVLYSEAAQLFDIIKDYKDSRERSAKCSKQSECCKIYDAGVEHTLSDANDKWEQAIECFKEIPGWENADEMVSVCERKIEEERLKKEKEGKKKIRNKRITAIVIIAIIGAIAIAIAVPEIKYATAVNALEKGNYEVVINRLHKETDCDMAKRILEKAVSVEVSKTSKNGLVIYVDGCNDLEVEARLNDADDYTTCEENGRIKFQDVELTNDNGTYYNGDGTEAAIYDEDGYPNKFILDFDYEDGETCLKSFFCHYEKINDDNGIYYKLSYVTIGDEKGYYVPRDY